MQTFGDRLKLMREARGWSQEKLGFELDVTKATVSKWENNRAEPGLRALKRIRHVFRAEDLSLDYLIDDATSVKQVATNTLMLQDGRAVYDPSTRIVETSDEQALLTRFRLLNDRKKKALLTLLED